MKTTFVALAFFMATVFSVNAQESKTHDKRDKTQTQQNDRTQNTQNQRSQAQNDQYVRDHTDRMARDLELTDDQKRRLQEQNNTLYNNNRSLDDNSDLSDADRRRMQKDYQDRYDRELEGILSEDQYKRYNSSRDQYNMNTAEDIRRNNNDGTNQRRGTSK